MTTQHPRQHLLSELDVSHFEQQVEESEKFFDNLMKDPLLPFLNAVKDFYKDGKLDVVDLGIEYEEAARNVKKKGAANKKKNEVLKETSTGNVDSVLVKKEKLSVQAKENVDVANMEMPAPVWIPPKKKVKEIKTERASVRSTRTRGKKASMRDSDVIIENLEIPTVDLSEESNRASTRSTRTKTRAQNLDISAADLSTTRSTRTKTRKQKTEAANETLEMETRGTRSKAVQKVVEEEAEKEETETETRSTRTRVIKKKLESVEEKADNSDDDSQMSTKSAKGETGRKGKQAREDEETTTEADDSQMSTTRSARTKTLRKAAKADTIENSDTEAPPSTRTKTIKKQASVETTTENPPELPKPGKKGATPREERATSKGKRTRSHEHDNNIQAPEERLTKKSKSNSPNNTSSKTVYEDAQSSLVIENVNNIQLNSTYIAPPKELKPVPPLKPLEAQPSIAADVANATMVVQEPRFNIFHKKSENDFYTDDDSIELNKSPKKVAPKSGKEVFSPYEKSTIKKKVEAFEKLQKISEAPSKLSGIPRSARQTPVKDKPKLYHTPLSKFMPGSCSTSKVSKLISNHQVSRSSSNDSLLKASSAQKDPRERQRKQLEKEQALKKKEAMLLAQAEAKKKLNEEKQLKALQQRKLIEAEKMKLLEVQKQKEDRQKLREQEREDYHQQQKLEIEKKRAAQKKKLQEIQAQRNAGQETHRPIYMTQAAPALPTEYCYDSDDPGYKKPTICPSWSSDRQIKIALLTSMAAGEKIRNTLYCRHAQTPDLTEIFENIDYKKLQRNSSRVWVKPPRFTMMPNLDETKFSEDEDDEVFINSVGRIRNNFSLSK